MRRFCLFLCLIVGDIASAGFAASPSAYTSRLGIVYEKINGESLTINAFLPPHSDKPLPAMMYIHGGWWTSGAAGSVIEQMPAYREMIRRHIAVFSVVYRLGADGGFPACIRDCRNAVRFIRKNAASFNIDPNRIGCMGVSAGGHLSLMLAMVPENFPDGGATPELLSVSARVCNAFSWVAVTDFSRHWNDGPSDIVSGPGGKPILRPVDLKIPNDSRPRYRMLFKGIAPDTDSHKAFYLAMSPVGYVSKNVAPLLICDGQKDPIVPGLEGKELFDRLRAVGADATYWMTANGTHRYPSGAGFDQLLDRFLVRTLKITAQ
jgi:acetyl esterase/lipase